MTANDLIHLHPADITLWLHVEKAVWRLAAASRTSLRFVRPTPKHLTQPRFEDSVLFGRCHFDKKVPQGVEITVRPYVKEASGWGCRRVRLYEVLDTICHEVAHAKAGWDADHGAAFSRAYGKLILLAEEINIRRDIISSGVRIPV